MVLNKVLILRNVVNLNDWKNTLQSSDGLWSVTTHSENDTYYIVVKHYTKYLKNRGTNGTNRV